MKYAVLAIMIIYVTNNWKESNLPKAVIILNAQEGLSKVLMIFEAHMADAYFGRFYVVVFSSLSMIVVSVIIIAYIHNDIHSYSRKDIFSLTKERISPFKGVND